MTHCIEYFATVGRPEGPFECKLWERDVGTGKFDVHPRDVWCEAITDIAFVMAKETVPVNQGWEVLRYSIDGREMNAPHLAVRRRKHSGRLDHITEIILVPALDKSPKKFEVIRHSISGIFSAYLNPLGFVAVRRADNSAAAYVEGEPFVDDFVLALLYHGEEVPERYIRASKYIPLRANDSTSLGTMGSLSMGLGSAFGGGGTSSAEKDSAELVALCYQKRPAMGLCDLKYTPVTLDRFPEQNLEGYELPVKELPMFAFPNDLTIELGMSLNRPKEAFFTFVFTDIKGNNTHATCLRFYEAVDHAVMDTLFESLYGAEKAIHILPGTAIYCPKVICVLSSKPYYRAMRRFLQQLFSMSISNLPCPLEYYIASVVGQVPLPVEGGRPFHVALDLHLISPSSKPMPALVFDLPPRCFFPLLDLDFSAPLRCLSVENMLAVFTLLLEEAKVLFISSSHVLLTETMEVLRALLFPLSWPSTFVSRLPIHMSTYLEAPGGFMIGFQVSSDPRSNQVHEQRKDGNMSLKGKVQPVVASIQSGTYIIDLTTNSIAQFDPNSDIVATLSPSRVATLIKALPAGARRRLTRKLDAICEEFQLGPQSHDLEQFDRVFGSSSSSALFSGDMLSGFVGLGTEGGVHTSPTNMHKSRRWCGGFPTLELRDAFMLFMIDIIGPSYTRFILPPPEDMAADTYRTFQESFDTFAYLEDADKDLRPLLSRLLETQMFAFLIQQRSEGSHTSLSFFEGAAELVRDFGLSCGGRSCSSTAVASSTSYTRSKGVDAELPYPLYMMLAADHRWAQCAPHHQDNILATHLKEVQVETRKSLYLPTLSSPLASLSAGPLRDRTFSGSNIPSSSGGVGNESSFTVDRKFPNNFHQRIGLVGLPGLEAALCMLRFVKSSGLLLLGHGDFSIASANKANPYAHEVIGGEHSGAATVSSLCDREEIDRGYDLHLHDASRGPLTLPGPSEITHLSDKSALASSAVRSRLARDNWLGDENNKTQSTQLSVVSANSANSLGTHPTSGLALASEDDAGVVRMRFIYPRGWPALDLALLSDARLSVNAQVKLLRERRLLANGFHKIVDSSLFCRTSAERFSFSHNGRLSSTLRHTSPLGAVTIAGSTQPYPQALSPETQAVIASVLDVIASSCLMMSLRVVRGLCPAADMLQVLGIFSQCESLGLLNHMDEVVFRCVLVSCAVQGGEFMRRVAAVVYDVMVWAGAKAPSAETSGQYLKALATKKERVSAVRAENGQEGPFGPNVYLEEMGSTWLRQHLSCRDEENREVRERSFSQGRELTSPHERLVSSSGGGGFFESIVSRTPTFAESRASPSKKIESTHALSPRFRRSVTAAAVASVAKRLDLVKDAGLLSFVGPHGLRWITCTRSACTDRAKALLSCSPTRTIKASSIHTLDDALHSRLERLQILTSTMSVAHSSLNSSSVTLQDKNNFHSRSGAIQECESSDLKSSSHISTSEADAIQDLRFSDDEGEDDDETDLAVAGNHSSVVAQLNDASEAKMLCKSQLLATSLTSPRIIDSATTTSPPITPTSAINVKFSEPPISREEEVNSPPPVASEISMLDEAVRDRMNSDPIKALQDKIISIIEAETKALGRAVGIFSRTPCECGHAMLDEEVLAFWVGFGHCQLNTHLASKDVRAAHRILCPDCHRDAAPLLHVQCYELKSVHAVDIAACSPTPTTILETCWSVKVELMSPFGLRFGLEEVVGLLGDIDGWWLNQNRPELFWSLLWYSLRLRLPQGLSYSTENRKSRLSSEVTPGEWTGPVVLGWRESVVRAQVFRLLCSSAHPITLNDVFSRCTEDDVDTARRVVAAMDGSTVGTRDALLLLVSIPNCTRDAGEGEGGGGARTARSLYVALLTIMFLSKPEMLTATSSDPLTVLLCLGKVSFWCMGAEIEK